MPYYAHTGLKSDQSDWQELRDHLYGVGNGAQRRAEATGLRFSDFPRVAWFAGLWHDIGKYRREFQQYLKGLQHKSDLTHHKQAGAALAHLHQRPETTFAIQGHHGGLPDFADAKTAIMSDSGTPLLERIMETIRREIPDVVKETPPPPTGSRDELDLVIRMLFSCLVDADWADTAAYQDSINGCSPESVPPALEPAVLLPRVLGYIGERARRAAEPMKSIRGEILKSCLLRAEETPGFFSMTVPTGGGKTLSGLAFALRHAAIHDLRRIICVAPYITIIEQNAKVIREALGVDDEQRTVFEHHSLAEPGTSDAQDDRRAEEFARRAENWDAPVIVTTNVQFFESLFSNRPGDCRKIHNIARSVIILDECQALPPGLLDPTCAMLKALVDQAGCSIVLSTATQPALKQRDEFPHGLTRVRELAPPSMDLFERLQRVTITWPERETRWSWSEVARQMVKKSSALVVVNTVEAARQLFRELRERVDDSKSVFHLSSAMCPFHRLRRIEEIKKRREVERSCFVVSTQLIECGVDLDFPFVLREFGPLDGIIQAAGRCNREGKLVAPDGSPGGEVIVFNSEEEKSPPGWYRKGIQNLRGRLDAHGPERQDRWTRPEGINEYFASLYPLGRCDEREIIKERESLNFRTIREGRGDRRGYRIIDEDTEPVLIVDWPPIQELVASLMEEWERRPTRQLRRKFSRYQVNVRTQNLDQSMIDKRRDGLGLWLGSYDSELGLSADLMRESLII
ncbi:Putative CRISPR-associated nuclease/helicase Cas3 [Planctomycetes bacterium Pan216]|uniref:CRISPR-associated nuclease/helicase Cas3 n=1 Tax=Kolteria novifilia TaxID=2527975 RepID=A0A518B5Z2_9BACT|nr:Putative CRISPR-associated nuclease/helicase Cas3 [Planctomycetes bacterium Pan216]